MVALGRQGSLEAPADNNWATQTAQVCQDAGVRFLGFYVATPEGVVRVEVGAAA